MASSSARESEATCRPRVLRVSRHEGPTISAVTRAVAAVLLTGNPLAPPRGASTASLRKGPPIDWPAVTRNRPPIDAPTRPKKPLREIVGAAGSGGASPPAAGG